MKNIKFTAVLILVLVAGCSRHVTMQDATYQAPEQYVEIIQATEDNQAEALAKLRELQHVEYKPYTIGIGDHFQVDVYGEPDLNMKDGVVKRDGTLSIILAGEVKIGGLEIPEAARLIEQKLAEYVQSPKVSLIPTNLVSAKVTIYGMVTRPGIYQLIGDMRILDIFAKAEGVGTGVQRGSSVVLGDLEHSFFIRDEKVLPIDFIKLIRDGDMLHNIPVQDGDYIHIASAVNKEIYVLGEVNHPDFFTYKEHMLLTQAIASVMGLKNTAGKYAIITRGGLTHPRMYKVNIEAILRGETRNVDLEPGDVVYIPRSGLAQFNNIMDLIVPSLQAVQSIGMIRDMVRDKE